VDPEEAYTKYKCKKDSIVEMTTPDQIKTEIQAHGPVETSFEVYQDFFSYKSGVYDPVSEDYVGNHAVKILGWGVENGTDYYLCANSWNASWGDSGFFKIKQGVCSVDTAVYACTPDVPTFLDLDDDDEQFTQ